MGKLSSQTILSGDPSLIHVMAERICATMKAEGYEIYFEDLENGGADISITHCQIFKMIGKEFPALKITLTPEDNAISFVAGVGIHRYQKIPTKIITNLFWPLTVVNVWSHVGQNCLDEKALAAARAVIYEKENPTYYSTDTTTPPPIPGSIINSEIPPIPQSSMDSPIPPDLPE